MPKSTEGMTNGSPTTPRNSCCCQNEISGQCSRARYCVQSDVMSPHFFKKGETVTKEAYLHVLMV